MSIKRIIAFWIIVSLAFSNSSTVKTGAATSPKLSKKSVVVNVNSSAEIKIVPKGWKVTKVTSKLSDKSKAKLTCSKKKVVVKAIESGETSATISITAKKSKKKKAFKLKVKITVNAVDSTEAITETSAEATTEAVSVFAIKDFTNMISDVVVKCNPSLQSDWDTLANKALKDNEEIKKDTAMLIIYEAACLMGIGSRATAYWIDFNNDYENIDSGFEKNYNPKGELFDNSGEPAPFQHLSFETAGWDYMTCAKLYAFGRSSAVDPNPFISIDSSEDYKKALTADEGRIAADRLYNAYLSEHEGFFDIRDYETDWTDSNLSEAYKKKQAILNSETKITKSDTFIQGETYTGTAYYVSNSGNDSNDGLTPNSAWCTLEKVTKADLKYGDIVFFERGGSWYGEIRMKKGVTYSAYGSGDKPIWTGSPKGIADSSKWEYYGETNDGGKLWKYVDKVEEVGVVLLNKYIVARKYVPLWDGYKYLASDAKSEFDFKRDLSVDGMYCSKIDLSGLTDVTNTVRANGRTGDLIMRCDKGNPGEVYSSIEMSMGGDLHITADDGYNTVDNICFRCFAGQGLDANSHDHIIFQNCESCWSGGAIQYYSYENGKYYALSSGGGMLLFGSHLIGRDNYIHDCESKGIAVVINGDGHASLSRKDIVAENNVVERCGNSIYMMTEFIPEGKTTAFEDVHIKNNYLINSGSGWRAHNQQWNSCYRGCYGSDCDAIKVNNIKKTGEVSFENNLIYNPLGSSVNLLLNKEISPNPKPEFKGNTFVYGKHTLFFSQETKNNEHAGFMFEGSNEKMSTISAGYLNDTTSIFKSIL